MQLNTKYVLSMLIAWTVVIVILYSWSSTYVAGKTEDIRRYMLSFLLDQSKTNQSATGSSFKNISITSSRYTFRFFANDVHRENKSDLYGNTDKRLKMTYMKRTSRFMGKDRFSDVYAKYARNWNKTQTMCMKSNNGQLGNKMFQFASLYGLSDVLGYEPFLCNRIMDYFHNKIFPLNNTVINSISVLDNCSAFRQTGDRIHASFDRFMLSRISSQGNIAISGFFQSWLYFYKQIEFIKTDFTFNNQVVTKAHNTLQNITREAKTRLSLKPRDNVTLVGVHVRWGDLSQSQYTQCGMVSPPASYYKNAIDYFKQKYHNTVFIVTSIFTKWVEKHLRWDNSSMFVMRQEREVDMALLAKCNHVIISTGTFGFWIGFLNKGEVIYYYTPVLFNSPCGRSYSEHLTDFYLPYWTPMS